MSSVPASFRAFRIHQHDGGVRAGFETLTLDDLSPGGVVVRVTHSSINYKDALAATGAGRILRRFPLVGGVDLAGVVLRSEDGRFHAGDAVLATGCGLSETLDGGYSEIARLPPETLVPMPDGLDAEAVMTVGTAGFAAALAVERLEHNGLAPGQGPVAVTGAAGGVGTIAIDMLAARGYQPVAVTGRTTLDEYLRALGAVDLVPREELLRAAQPLGTARWAGAIDNVGGAVLHALLAAMKPQGGVASVGLAGGAELHTTVMPFILRGVNLLGVNSSATARPLREKLWRRIATDLRPRHFDLIRTADVPFDALPGAFQAYLDGAVRGRQVVRIA